LKHVALLKNKKDCAVVYCVTLMEYINKMTLLNQVGISNYFMYIMHLNLPHL